MTLMNKVNLLLFLNKQKISVKNTQNPFNLIFKTQTFKIKPIDANKTICVISLKIKLKIFTAPKTFNHKILFLGF